VGSLRRLQAAWRPILEEEFTLQHSYDFVQRQSPVGMFVRHARITGYRTPNGLERVEGRPFFWLGNAAAQIEIRNFDTNERSLEFIADTQPGPSNADRDKRRVRYEWGETRGVLVIGRDTKWRLSLPLTLRPGLNVLSLQGLDSADTALNPNGDPRPLVLRLDNMRLIRPPGGHAPS
jgi:hypothetical protein